MVLKEKMTAKRNGSPTTTGTIIGIVAAICVTGAALAGSEGLIQIPGIGPRMQLNQASSAPIFQPPPGAPLSFADIFERVSPAVVSIIVKADIPVTRQQVPNIPGLPPGFQLFPGQPDDSGPDTREAQAEGSGFFISADGYIVTNNHVVANSKEITVTMTDKHELKATVVGRDQSTDLAVIKVEKVGGRNFPFVNFENSAVPRVGDWVISIGNPFGLGGTATAGIVSAYNRNLPNDDEPASRFVDYLQIDSAINRGNSGGPTFDVYGRVIGVNSAIYSPGQSGGSVGIGFAIPASVAENVAKQLIERGSITRGYLGAGVRPYDKDLAESIGRDFPEGAGGAFVSEIVENGPAERGGLQVGDIILQLNGQKIADATALTRAAAASKPGDTLRIEVLREGKTVNLTVRSGTRPGEDDLDNPNADRSGTGGGAPKGGNRGGRGGRGGAVPEERQPGPTVMGVEMGTVDAAARRQYVIPDEINGVLVIGIDQASSFASNLQPGDVIVRAGDKAVSKPSEVQAVIAAQKATGRKTVLMFISRRGDDGARTTISGILSLEEDATPPARGGRGGRGGGGRGGAPGGGRGGGGAQ